MVSVSHRDAADDHSTHMAPGTSATIVANKSPSKQIKRHVTFGPYLIGSTLGEGEFGKVKVGWTRPSKNLGEIPKQVAIKLIRRNTIVKNSEREIKVYREINALKHLTHPNIIGLEEVLQNSKYIGIVLEYASGGEFYKYIQKKKRLDEFKACKIFAELMSGVNYMHSKGLVHRDLKLENLLLDSNENLLITDFGFVNEFRRDHELMQTSCGSPCYAAPELVVTTKPYKGRKADIWSCGIILFAMLAGYLPWDDDPSNPKGDDIPKLYHYITTTKLKFPEYISALPRDLLRKILVSDPRKRIDLPQLIEHRWLEAHHNFLTVTSGEWDTIMKSKTHERKSRRKSHVLITNTNINRSSHDKRKDRGTSFMITPTFMPTTATQHTHQQDVLGEATLQGKREMSGERRERKANRRNSVASVALKAVVESDEYVIASATPEISPIQPYGSNSQDVLINENMNLDKPMKTAVGNDALLSIKHTQNSSSEEILTPNIKNDHMKDNNSLHPFSTHHKKPRPVTYHLTLHSAMPEDSSKHTTHDSIEESSRHSISDGDLKPSNIDLSPFDVTDVTSSSIDNPWIVTKLQQNGNLDNIKQNHDQGKLRTESLNDNYAINRMSEEKDPIKNNFSRSSENLNPISNNVLTSSDLTSNSGMEKISRKRFSILSFYSSFNNSKTSVHTEVSPTLAISSSRCQNNSDIIRNRSGTASSMASDSRVAEMNNSHMSERDNSHNFKKEHTQKMKQPPSRHNVRSSIMVSSLVQDTRSTRTPTNNTSNQPQRDASRTKKVLAFFKRRSMKI